LNLNVKGAAWFLQLKPKSGSSARAMVVPNKSSSKTAAAANILLYMAPS
jgi:hypothetical protein